MRGEGLLSLFNPSRSKRFGINEKEGKERRERKGGGT